LLWVINTGNELSSCGSRTWTFAGLPTGLQSTNHKTISHHSWSSVLSGCGSDDDDDDDGNPFGKLGLWALKGLGF
jgi:hypothetical protein